MKDRKFVLWQLVYVFSFCLCFLAAAGNARAASGPEHEEALVPEEYVITGKVTDDLGNPLAGASVLIKDAPLSKGVVTDLDGNFSMTVSPKSVLLISYVGFRDMRLPVLARKKLNVILEMDTEFLDDVVVVGYGTQKKSDLTGSIASVDAKDIRNVPARSMAEALQGKVAGVMVSKNDGTPGSSSDIVIRGVGSINGLNPLFVIDGVAVENTADYNLSDIESIEIIKDASAAAIYGSRAAGGVILVTTKKGNYNSAPRLSFSARVGVRSLSDMYEMLDTQDYIRVKQALGENYSLWNDPSSLPYTDWTDEIYRNGLEHSYNLSLSGGGGKIRYYLAGAYERENGTQVDNWWERISARLNVDYAVNKAVTVGTRIYFARLRENPYTLSFPWVSIPFMSVKNPDGSWTAIPDGIDTSAGNPRGDIGLHHYKSSDIVGNADLYVDWNIVDGLKLNVTGAAHFGGGYEDNYTEANDLGRSPTTDSYYKYLDYSEEYTLTTTLSYSKVFGGKHDFNVMAGFEAKAANYAFVSGTATDFPISDPQSFALSAVDDMSASGTLSYDRFLSFFGRVTYSYDNRYLFTANFRRDGSPKFGPNHRWGNFPSFSAGWKISEEPFFKNWSQNWLTSVKPRVSWGILGNDTALASYSYLSSFKNVTVHSFDGSSAVSGYNNPKVINEDIKWESIRTIDAGIDLDFFDNRLFLSFDWYRRITKDMIYALSVPPSSGITQPSSLGTMSTVPVNLGRIDNNGWELLVSYRNNVGGLNYSVSANVSQNRNKVIDLGLPTAYIYGGGGHPNEGPSPCKTVNGMPVSSFWGLKTDGMITSQEEIDELNAIARSNGHEYYHQRLTGVGDLKFVDLNGDGTINDDDCTFIGNPWPKVQYGFTISLDYKGIDFTADFLGVAGNDVMNLSKSYTQSVVQSSNTTAEVFKSSYFMGNGLTDRPRIMALDPSNGNAVVKDPNRNYARYSDYFIEDGSYLKLKNVTIGYTFPRRWTRKARIDRLRIYVTGNNLLTFTKFTGLDPEFAGASKTASGVYYGSTYPQTRMVAFGVDLSF